METIKITKPRQRWLFGGVGFQNSEATIQHPRESLPKLCFTLRATLLLDDSACDFGTVRVSCSAFPPNDFVRPKGHSSAKRRNYRNCPKNIDKIGKMWYNAFVRKYVERIWPSWSDGVKSIHTLTRGIGVALPFSGIRSRVFIKVCSFSKYFEIGLTFFRSYAENTIGDYIPERSVQPMKEKTPDIRTPA